MGWTERLQQALAAERALARQVYDAGPDPESTFWPFVRHQQEQFGLGSAELRLPEHFRGRWEEAQVCFIGPHVLLVPEEPAPAVGAGVEEYLAYYRDRPEKRDPYGHYQAIMDGAPYLATELVHWPCEKELALTVLKSKQGPAAVAAALELTWAMLRESPVETLVLTGNDALKWVLPHLGWTGGALPGVTQLHGQVLGRFGLPGAPGRELKVVASFHWSKEMPLFVRKVAGLGGLTPREAVSESRRMIARAIGA
ncbi:MAG TPA: hypothetical protein VK464_05665 [Symbiobacteriaceae bacterium]|nr:hypothetical protein [Symbiobacteriaceae bacterium]